MEKILQKKLDQLQNDLHEMGHVLVAYSGGVDSSFLLKVAGKVLGKKALALTAVSPSLPQEEKRKTLQFAKQLGVEHLLIPSHELKNPNYAKNPVDRCYFCKTELYRLCRQEASKRNIPWIVDGFNFDDQSDYRPGFKAKVKHKVRSPLLEAGLTKKDIRTLSRYLKVPTWEKPASPCLASRIPYGTAINSEILGKIERLEAFLRQNGLKEFRVRYHEKTARLETSEKDFSVICKKTLRQKWIDQCRKEGFEFVTLDLEGFRSGRLNEAYLKRSNRGSRSL